MRAKHRLTTISLAALACALAQAASAQTALPDINISSPLRAHPRPAPAAQPVVSDPRPAAAVSQPSGAAPRRIAQGAPAPAPRPRRRANTAARRPDPGSVCRRDDPGGHQHHHREGNRADA